MYAYRTWQPADLPWLEGAAAAAAWESLSAEEQAGAPPAVVAHVAQQQLREVLGSGWGTALVAGAGGQFAGFILGALGPDSTTDEVNGHIFTMWVAPMHRRRGVGRRLLGMIEQLLGGKEVRKLKLWTGMHNAPAVAMIRSSGYEPEGLIGMKHL